MLVNHELCDKIAHHQAIEFLIFLYQSRKVLNDPKTQEEKSSILSRWDYQAENPLAAFKALCEKCIWRDFPLLFEYK